jgi:deubiquitinase DESI2
MSLLHSGVVVNDKEFAFGGHDQAGISGVYWTKPRTEPPGGTFKCEILHGFTFAAQEEIDAIIHDVSNEFQGTAYNILTKNCNHFTSRLCQRLTGRTAPGWLNRAASVGVALPCVVPREWIEPPDYGQAEGELLEEEEYADERSRMLDRASHQRLLQDNVEAEDDLAQSAPTDIRRPNQSRGKGKGKGPLLDSSGRRIPPADIAPSLR